jgi:hypothetical protein
VIRLSGQSCQARCDVSSPAIFIEIAGCFL